jgi:hypothetical protein
LKRATLLEKGVTEKFVELMVVEYEHASLASLPTSHLFTGKQLSYRLFVAAQSSLKVLGLIAGNLLLYESRSEHPLATNLSTPWVSRKT